MTSGDVSLLVLVALIAGGIWFWLDSLKAREIAVAEGTRLCELQSFQFLDWTVAQTEDQYVAGALRMIHEDDLRAELSAQALALDINTLMFGDGTTPLASDVIDLVWKTYENHEAVMASPLRALKLADVEAIAALGA